jgi:CO dehydrogenase/acetyl-CoA synthase beta subunit
MKSLRLGGVEHPSEISEILHRFACGNGQLRAWSAVKFGNVCRELKNSRQQVEQFRMQGAAEDSVSVKETMAKMDELLYREEMLWLQRSRITWLKEGDKNTDFFYQKAQWSARKNRIKKLKKEDGLWGRK